MNSYIVPQQNHRHSTLAKLEHKTWQIDTLVTLTVGVRETTATETDTAETTASETEITTVAVVGEEVGGAETIEIETADDTGPDPETGMVVTMTVTAGARAPRFATEMGTIDATTGPETEVEEAGVAVLKTLAVIEVTSIRIV